MSLAFVVTMVWSCFSQELTPTHTVIRDTTGATWRKFAVPAALVGSGVFVLTDNDIVDRFELREERNEAMPKFRHHADDYVQYSPVIAAYALDLAGVKSKTDLANRTAILIKAEMLMGISVYSLKKITAVPRPDTGQPTSFPSGHTAQAFAAATFFSHEYGDRSIWYSVGAYAIATGIGTMRVLNNRHWASDVLVGAGIGILSTELAYTTHQFRWGKGTRRRAHSLFVVPEIGKTNGAYLSYRI